jgi:hypothetical protein
MTTTTYAADSTALLIVDPYNDFMSEGGKLYEATKETAQAVGFYDNMRKLIPAIRAARIQVIIVPHHRWQEGDYNGWKHMNPSQVQVNQTHNFAAGTWGGEFHPEFGPRDGDVVALEHWAQSASPIPISTHNSNSGGSRRSSLSVLSRIPASNPPLALAWSLVTMSPSLRMRPPHSTAKACTRRTR